MDEETAACVRLARAKLVEMFRDLTKRSAGNPREKESLRNQAINWFFGKSDFEQWCAAAGYEPTFVREKAKEIAETGFEWRVEAGKGKRHEERKRYRQRIKAQQEPRA